MEPVMDFEPVGSGIFFSANFTAEWLNFGVYEHMAFQISFCTKTFFAGITIKWFLPSLSNVDT